MTTATSVQTNRPIDQALVARVVREVIARLAASNSTKTDVTAAAIDDPVVSTATIENIQGSAKQLFVRHGAVVTPAARDEAARRGITINHAVKIVPSQQPPRVQVAGGDPSRTFPITDRGQPDRATAVANQLVKRGIDSLTVAVVLSDTPALDVHRLCAVDDERAVMIGSLAEVDRFSVELDPTAWVLDMARINFVAAVNIVARIAQRRN